MIICEGHQERPTPMIYTFAFPRCEYWCPYCGERGGEFGTGKCVEETPELKATAEQDVVNSKEYLHAVATQSCQNLEFEGRNISPDSLPAAEKMRLLRIRLAWCYPAANTRPASEGER